jgi:hypothetical protein
MEELKVEGDCLAEVGPGMELMTWEIDTLNAYARRWAMLQEDWRAP